MTTTGIHLGRESAVIDGGKRRCANCGDYIDPIDWCAGCAGGTPCRKPHRRVRKRADAAYCNGACRANRRYTFIRDCL
jgi:hypothetical protein